MSNNRFESVTNNHQTEKPSWHEPARENTFHHQIYSPEHRNDWNQQRAISANNWHHPAAQQNTEAHQILNGFGITGLHEMPSANQGLQVSRGNFAGQSSVESQLTALGVTNFITDDNQRNATQSFPIGSDNSPSVRNQWANDVEQAANPLNGFQSAITNMWKGLTHHDS